MTARGWAATVLGVAYLLTLLALIRAEPTDDEKG